MTDRSASEEPRRDGSGDDAGNFDDDFEDEATHARRRLETPAMLLIIATTITIVPCFLFLAFGLYLFIDGLPPAEPTKEFELGVIVTGVGLFAVMYLMAILRGAILMRQFRNYGMARVAVILGVVSVVFLQVASVFILPSAIWAWVVLRDPLVKKQFRSL